MKRTRRNPLLVGVVPSLHSSVCGGGGGNAAGTQEKRTSLTFSFLLFDGGG